MNTLPSDYFVRLAKAGDEARVAALWWPFVCSRAEADPSLRLRAQVDAQSFINFVIRELAAPNLHCWLLEHDAGDPEPRSVGCILWYLDEEPVDPLSPFEARRCAKVLGIYVDPDHRDPACIDGLAARAHEHAESFGVTDIDLLVSSEQSGLHSLLERRGFTRAAVQFARHYPPPQDSRRPSEPGESRSVRSTRLGHRLALD